MWCNSEEEMVVNKDFKNTAVSFKGYVAKFERDYRIDVSDDNKRFKNTWKIRTEVIIHGSTHCFYGDSFENYAYRSNAVQRIKKILEGMIVATKEN